MIDLLEGTPRFLLCGKYRGSDKHLDQEKQYSNHIYDRYAERCKLVESQRPRHVHYKKPRIE